MKCLLVYLAAALLASPFGDCHVEVKEFKTQLIAGKNVGFYVLFENKSTKSVDAIEYKVSFYDNFGEYISSDTYMWQAGNFDKPFAPGNTKLNIKNSWVDGANKIKVRIIRVHYTDDTMCRY